MDRLLKIIYGDLKSVSSDHKSVMTLLQIASKVATCAKDKLDVLKYLRASSKHKNVTL